MINGSNRNVTQVQLAGISSISDSMSLISASHLPLCRPTCFCGMITWQEEASFVSATAWSRMQIARTTYNGNIIFIHQLKLIADGTKAPKVWTSNVCSYVGYSIWTCSFSVIINTITINKWANTNQSGMFYTTCDKTCIHILRYTIDSIQAQTVSFSAYGTWKHQELLSV